jgi:hypothetical protein
MDPEPKQSRRGVAIIIAVLVVVCVWWLLFFPRTGLYRNYKEKSDLERTLRAIRLPAGATLDGIYMVQDGKKWLAVGRYLTWAEIETVESHYKQEFPRHGFVYQEQEKETSKESPTTLRFCAQGYLATLSASNMRLEHGPRLYMIFLRDGDCGSFKVSR